MFQFYNEHVFRQVKLHVLSHQNDCQFHATLPSSNKKAKSSVMSSEDYGPRMVLKEIKREIYELNFKCLF